MPDDSQTLSVLGFCDFAEFFAPFSCCFTQDLLPMPLCCSSAHGIADSIRPCGCAGDLFVSPFVRHASCEVCPLLGVFRKLSCRLRLRICAFIERLTTVRFDFDKEGACALLRSRRRRKRRQNYRRPLFSSRAPAMHPGQLYKNGPISKGVTPRRTAENQAFKLALASDE